MTDRQEERLVELLEQTGMLDSKSRCRIAAEELLANGVIVPQCNFKDTIYRVSSKGKIYGDWELMYIQVYPDEILYIDDSDNYFTAKEIGKTVFLTKEEAEAELHKRGVSNAENN